MHNFFFYKKDINDASQTFTLVFEFEGASFWSQLDHKCSNNGKYVWGPNLPIYFYERTLSFFLPFSTQISWRQKIPFGAELNIQWEQISCLKSQGGKTTFDGVVTCNKPSLCSVYQQCCQLCHFQ